MDKKQRILEALKMQPLSEEEKQKRHILGRLYGPIATCTESTRNGRRYNKELWEKALTDEVFKEKVANKSLFLELGHPQDREETDMEKVCACIPELPQIVDGDLYAYVDILDTNNGRLLKTLCDYGFVPGISSRGSGDIMPNDEVDPETFFLETWDIVQLPAVKKARLSVCESYEPQKEALKKALVESYNKKSKEEQKEMKETLDNLQLDVDLTEARGKKKDKKKDSADYLPNGTPRKLSDIPFMDMPETQFESLNEENEEAEDEILDTDTDIKEVDDVDLIDDQEADDIVPVDEIPTDDDTDKADETKDTDSEEFDVTTLEDFLNIFEDADKDAEVIFNPIVIDGKEYEDLEYSVNLDKDENKVYIDIICNDTENDSADKEEEAEIEIEEQPKDEDEADVEADEADKGEADEKADSDKDEEADEEAIDDGLADVLENLKELVRTKELLESEIKSLRQSKTVSDAKVEKVTKELTRYKESFERTSAIAAKANELNKKVEKLTEAIEVKDNQIFELRAKYAKTSKIRESLETKATESKQLTESLETAKADAENKVDSLTKQLTESKKLVEQRTGIAKRYKDRYEAVLNHYVDSKAKMLGVPSSKILGQLTENYTVEDVDRVCDEMLTSTVNINSLPFNSRTHARVVESAKAPVKKAPANTLESGYEIDDSLLQLAGLKD